MSLNIKNETVDRLARKVAALSGKSITEAIEQALRAELARLDAKGAKRPTKSVGEQLQAIQDELKRFTVLDARSPEDILGYGPDGLAR